MTNHAHPTTRADADIDTGADTAPPEWATTRTMPVAPAPATAPALNPPVWSGRKTAIAAALAIGISSVGAVAAAAALPAGSTQGGSGQFQPGGFPGRGQGGLGQPGQPGGSGQQGFGQQVQPGQGGVAQQGQPGVAPADPRVATP